MSEDELDFDFGTWCPVCDRAISVPAPAASPDERPAISPAASHHSAKVKRTPSTAEKKDGIGGRKKSSGKLHHPRHGKSHSHTSLHTLAVSTPLHPPPVTPPTPSEEEQAHLNPPSSLYCSEECRRIDEMRSRLAFAHLGPSSTSTAVRPLLDHSRRHSMGGARESEEPSEAVSRRRSSGLSLRVQARSGASYGMTNGYSSGYSGLESGSFAGGGGGGGGGGREQNMGLDFSTRRNSRGSEGAYSFRPSLMQRVPSTEEGSYGTRSRGSTDSLASMGEADERSDRGYSARPPSALSALRFMTPISPLPSSSPSRARRPPNLLRNNTDAPRATVFRADSPNEGRRVSPNATGSKSKQIKINSPPMPSPRALAGGSESCPDQSTEGLAEIEAALTTGRPPPSLFSQSPTSRKPSRTASSASLSLMGTSLGRSYGRSIDKGGWGAPNRTQSTAVLSGLVALGTMVTSAELSNPSASSIPRPSSSFRHHRAHRSTTSIPRLPTSPSSPSSTSNSSFAPSHFSARSSQRSTAGSSDQGYLYHPKEDASHSSGYSPRQINLSSSAGSQPRHPGGTTGRKVKGLMITPSTSSLSAAGSSYGDSPELQRRERRESWTDERTPTQSLNKPTSLHGNSGGTTNLATALANAREEESTIRRPKDARAMSTPSTARRPRLADLVPPSPGSPSLHPVHPANAAGLNPSLAYLYPDSPGRMTSKSRNWSWDNLRVPTYTALDVEQVRRDKKEKEGSREGEAPVKERKRLFYFSEAGE